MRGKILGAGLLGALVLIAWTFVVNGVFGLQSRLDMKRVTAEEQVHEAIWDNLSGPGRYIINPPPAPKGVPPGEGPVFSVLFSGVGHPAAGRLMLLDFVLFLLTPLLAAWLLSQASDRVLADYPRKVLFVSALGLLLALACDIPRFGIGGYPPQDALMFAANRLITWTLVGAAISWRLRPGHR
jgi:hypothetical protein